MLSDLPQARKSAIVLGAILSSALLSLDHPNPQPKHQTPTLMRRDTVSTHPYTASLTLYRFRYVHGARAAHHRR